LLHVTVHFLGSANVNLVPGITDALRDAVGLCHPFTLTLGTHGAFPTTERPRVLWVGLGGEVGALQQLNAAVVSALSPLGFPRDSRPYHPHVTIGRVRRDAAPAALRVVARTLGTIAVPGSVHFRVNRVTLFRTTHARGALRHVEVAAAPLERADSDV
jgi:2'-5' RNA ligase